MLKWKSQRGNTSLAEYAVTVFLVITSITAMTIYVQRTLQARMRDARHYMVKTVGQACDEAYCGPAANLTRYLTNVGGLPANLQKIGDQYEPYYAQVDSMVNMEKEKNRKLMASDVGSSGVFMEQRTGQTSAQTMSNQASPIYARTDRDLVLASEGDY